MAPPRQRTTANVDDSRSEASSSTKELKGTNSKSRRPANVTTTTAIAAKETKVTTTTVTTVPSVATAPEAEQAEELPRIPWPQMPLRILHDYRHAYRLSTPSAYSKPYNALLLSQGIGLRSPTSLAVRRAQQLSRSHHRDLNGTSSANGTTPEESEHGMGTDVHSGVNTTAKYDLHIHDRGHGHERHQRHLHRIIGQGRVSKEQLALAVRKHFNSAGLVEQEAIARFLYKVREEGKGRQFRLRFQP